MEKQRYISTLVGLAIGDCLGVTLEFKRRGTFPRHTDIVGGGPFEFKAGEFSDDTSMALCLAQSLIDCSGFDARDQLTKYYQWVVHGYMSSNDKPAVDVGRTCGESIIRFAHTDQIDAPVDEMGAGNGSLMRLAPVAMFYAHAPLKAIEMCGDSSRTTHGAQEAVDACKYFGFLIVGALRGLNKEQILDDSFYPRVTSLTPKIADIALGKFKILDEHELKPSGYVVESLKCALWAIHNSCDYESAVIKAVNLGGDADTIGAITGMLAGALYQNIPDRWTQKLVKRDLIEDLAAKLFELAPV